MPAALVCASHTPLMMEKDFADQETCDLVTNSFSQMAEFAAEFDPECIVQFSPDHFHGFHYDLMPSFCIGAAARACGDWNTHEGPLRVDEEFANDILAATRTADFDVAISYDMLLDHGFTQIWEQMFGAIDRYQIVPIFVNCIGVPLPSYRRARLLGAEVGRYVAASGKRVLFAASGGLSHDPVVPDIRTANASVRERLIHGAGTWKAAQPQREIQVREAAAAAMRKEGPAMPLNVEWDRQVIDILNSGNLELFDQFDDRNVASIAGSGANETLCWVAAFSALRAAGPSDIVYQLYKDIPGWIIGMALLAARTK